MNQEKCGAFAKVLCVVTFVSFCLQLSCNLQTSIKMAGKINRSNSDVNANEGSEGSPAASRKTSRAVEPDLVVRVLLRGKGRTRHRHIGDRTCLHRKAFSPG